MKYESLVKAVSVSVIAVLTAAVTFTIWLFSGVMGEEVTSKLFVLLASVNSFYLIRECANDASTDMIERKNRLNENQ